MLGCRLESGLHKNSIFDQLVHRNRKETKILKSSSLFTCLCYHNCGISAVVAGRAGFSESGLTRCVKFICCAAIVRITADCSSICVNRWQSMRWGCACWTPAKHRHGRNTAEAMGEDVTLRNIRNGRQKRDCGEIRLFCVCILQDAHKSDTIRTERWHRKINMNFSQI